MRTFLRLVAVVSYVFAAICAVGLIVMTVNYNDIKGSRALAYTCTFGAGFGFFYGARWIWQRIVR